MMSYLAESFGSPFQKASAVKTVERLQNFWEDDIGSRGKDMTMSE